MYYEVLLQPRKPHRQHWNTDIVEWVGVFIAVSKSMSMKQVSRESFVSGNFRDRPSLSPGRRLQTIAWFSNKKQKTFWPDRVWTNIDQFIAMRLCKSCMTDAKWSAKKIDVFFIPSFSLNWIESSNWLKGRLLFVMILTWFLLPWNSA